MDYVQITDADRDAMLRTIGVKNIDDLYATLPDSARFTRALDLPPAMSELELQRELAVLGAANHPAVAPDAACFMGGGAYDHFIPSVVDALAGKGEFVTAYTPYQAEASQGSLQAFFEFQTQVCRLTGMDVSNASLYEGATAVAEAVLMSLNATGRRRVLISAAVHPHYRAVVKTYMTDLPVEYIEIPLAGGVTDIAATKRLLEAGRGDTACVVVQSPNVLGMIEDWAAHFGAAHESKTPDGAAAGTLGVAVFNPMACGLLKKPGDCGADIAAGEGQPMGVPLQFGGPWLGLFAAKNALMRRMPGRLVGQTTDSEGRRAFCLTLQTREQHIRRDKATSNVCTNQGLLAVRATIYMSAMGPAGLRGAAEQCYHKAHHAASLIAQIPGYSLAHNGPFFNEFVVNCPVPARKVIDAGRAKSPRILPGIDCASLGVGNEKQLLVAVTEKRTRGEIDSLAALLRETH